MKNKEGLIALGVILSMILIGAFMVYEQVTYVDKDCRDVYCNDFEFICCGEKQDSTGSVKLGYLIWTGTKTGEYYWQCPTTASRCEIQTSASIHFGTKNCRLVQGGIPPDTYWYCDDEVTRGIGTYSIAPNDFAYSGKLSTGIITFRVFKENLAWCGSAACDAGKTGISVQGANGCTFVTNQNIYDKNGKLIQEVTAGDIAYTVPLGECYLSASSRHQCGDTCEACSSNSDCILGHTLEYKGYGAECHTGQVDMYGCRDYGTRCIEKDILPDGTEKCLISIPQSRCEFIKSEKVQCCPYTDSCSQGFCDPETFTCKSGGEVTCSADWECGQIQRCDRGSMELQEKTCINDGTVNSYCGWKTVKEVSCCYDEDCPSGYTCGADYTCKEEVGYKKSCPYTCCVDETKYFDRPCSADGICCDSHSCCSKNQVCCPSGGCATSLDKCGGNGECMDTCKWYDVICMFTCLSTGCGMFDFGCWFERGRFIISVLGALIGTVAVYNYLGGRKPKRGKGKKSKPMMKTERQRWAISLIAGILLGWLVYELILIEIAIAMLIFLIAVVALILKILI